ncbi:hypothetical protein HELRODRAFT_160497 [Helobdella robusta]|uniref:Uncharacterized protein n=1 Tax=Helobdella robusta TaxID=6412 RepID=T1EQB6_HELRO|nr:hypothetical protein HELRODRAFT_160497 [Helobdella robusta]ESO06333.1 hypothetical protein HELRODRAFT_160497 [Helobdella robusta]
MQTTTATKVSNKILHNISTNSTKRQNNSLNYEKDEQYLDDQPIGMQTTTQTLTTSSPTWLDNLTNMAKDPMIQLFGIVFILFFLTAILATVNFCIWYFEKRRRRGPVHWRASPGVDIISTTSRPPGQTPKRSFHIQHALYKTVRRPSAMPP